MKLSIKKISNPTSQYLLKYAKIAPGEEMAKDQIMDSLTSQYKEKYVVVDSEGMVHGAIAFGLRTDPGMGEVVEVHHVGSYGNGYGTKLLAKAILFAKKRKVPVLLFSRKEAIPFYLKLGFEQIEGRPEGLFIYYPK